MSHSVLSTSANTPLRAGYVDRLRRFEKEARTVRTLNHRNIPTMYDIGTRDGSPYIVFALLDGGQARGEIFSVALHSAAESQSSRSATGLIQLTVCCI